MSVDERNDLYFQALREKPGVMAYYDRLKEYATSQSTYPQIKDRRYDMISYSIGYWGMITEACYYAINLLAHEHIIDY